MAVAQIRLCGFAVMCFPLFILTEIDQRRLYYRECERAAAGRRARGAAHRLKLELAQARRRHLILIAVCCLLWRSKKHDCEKYEFEKYT